MGALLWCPFVHVSPHGRPAGHSVRQRKSACLIGDNQVKATVADESKCGQIGWRHELNGAMGAKGEQQHTERSLRQRGQRFCNLQMLRCSCGFRSISDGRDVSVVCQHGQLSQDSGILGKVRKRNGEDARPCRLGANHCAAPPFPSPFQAFCRPRPATPPHAR